MLQPLPLWPRRRLVRTVFACGAAVAVASSGWNAEVTADAGCDSELLVAMHRRIEPTVREIMKVHYNFSGGRLYEVVEKISIFQTDRLCRSALNVVESLRLALAILVCPSRYVTQDIMDNLPGVLRLPEHAEAYFADVRYVANGGGAQDVPEARTAWDMAASEMIEVANKLAEWIRQSIGTGSRVYADVYTNIEPLIVRMLSSTLDFLKSLTEDMSTLFRAPNYIGQDMMPPTEDKMFSADETAKSSVSIYSTRHGGQAFNPAFISMLGSPAKPLSQPSFFPHAP